MKPTTPPPSTESPPSKKPRTKAPATNTAPTQYFHINVEEEYPLHKKYELQDDSSTKYEAIAKAARLTRDNEKFSVDLPAYFVYHRDNKHWTLIKGPASQFHDVGWYEYIEQLYKRGTKHRNTVYWLTSWRNPAVTPLRWRTIIS